MDADHQVAAGSDFCFDLFKQLLLHQLLKIGKKKIAAEYQVKLPFGHLAADILPQKGHRFLVLSPETAAAVLGNKGGLKPRFRQRFEAAVKIAPLLGP